jgi:hypothetical protein
MSSEPNIKHREKFCSYRNFAPYGGEFVIDGVWAARANAGAEPSFYGAWLAECCATSSEITYCRNASLR